MFSTTTKKKILYRQDKFSQVLTLKNKNNLDYFYIDDKYEKSTPKKFKIQKINSQVTEQKKKKQ